MAMTREERALRKAKKQEDASRNAKRIAEAQAIARSGKCPQCESPLRNNLALTGWVQCSQYGADSFRKDSSKPSCDFQCFTC